MISSDGLPVMKDLIQEAPQALEGGKEADVVKASNSLHQVIEGGVLGLPLMASAYQLLQEVIYFLEQAISGPSPATDLPAHLKSYPALNDLYSNLLELRQFFLALVEGDLSRELRMKGYLAGVLKSLQANLRHLTWQTQMIASGDFSQRVDFMGEFSGAFNAMVIQLDKSLQQIKEKEAELTRINGELRQEIELRKTTEESLRQSEGLYRQLAITDPLTGIFNRRHFYQMAESELQRTCRYCRPLAVIMIDIDYFKRVNDSYGHAIGDQVLQALASLIRGTLRSIDVFARYGGEEFIVLLPETDLRAVKPIAERLRRKIAETPLPIEPNHLNITISLGASAFDPSVQSLLSSNKRTLDQIIDSADKALYEAKEAGRNRVCISNVVPNDGPKEE
jgi:diguanylate cyclase (GGDEF)-like protein